MPLQQLKGMQRSTLVCERGTSWLIQSQLDAKNCVSSGVRMKKIEMRKLSLRNHNLQRPPTYIEISTVYLHEHLEKMLE